MRPRPDSKCVEKSKEMADSAAILKNLLRDANVSRYYLDLLKTNCHLYDAHLRRMRFDDYLLQLSPDHEPVHAKPYPILRSLNNSAKAEIQRLIKLNALEQTCNIKMASIAFLCQDQTLLRLTSTELLDTSQSIRRPSDPQDCYIPQKYGA